MDRRHGNPIRQLSHEAKMRNSVWSGAEFTLVAERQFGPYAQLYSVDTESGTLKQLTHWSGDLCSWAIGNKGRLAMIVSDADGRTSITVARLNSGGTLTVLGRTMAIAMPTNGMRFGEVREVGWQSSDGIDSRGLLFLPLDYERGARYPLIVNLHGGLVGSPMRMTEGALNLGTPFEFHMWAAKGFAVFLPEFRSSGALGSRAGAQLASAREVHGFHADAKDILSGIDHLVNEGLVDEARVGLMGFSGGAAETNWLVATTRGRFRVAVSYEGFGEVYLLSAVGAAIGGDPDARQVLGGWPWEVPGRYLENSAISHVGGADTPTLFLMGDQEASGVDPALSVQFLYSALKRQGVDTRYIRYSGEGHSFRRAANVRDVVTRAVNWIDSHLATH
jgi:dipeptidyl aminopeptidase/acylaminoacyl peptidase